MRACTVDFTSRVGPLVHHENPDLSPPLKEDRGGDVWLVPEESTGREGDMGSDEVDGKGVFTS